MKKLTQGCTRTEIWASPENWQTTTAKSSLKKNWYIQCDFFDPVFKKKYPNGFQFRKKLNRFQTIDERRGVILYMMQEMEKVLDKKLYNPISKKYMTTDIKPGPGSITSNTNFIEALRINYLTLSVSEGVKKEMRRIINNVETQADKLKIEFPIYEMHSGHVRDFLDEMRLTPNEYNKYLTHLSIIITDLVEKRMILHNPIRDIKKKKTLKKIREVFEVEEARQIFKYLKVHHPEFYRYGMIFFHSGSRTAELFRLQAKNVFLYKQEFKLTIEKGSHSKEVMKPILSNALNLWIELMQLCDSKEDYLFSKGLKPGIDPIQPYQITKRFKRLVKDKLVFKNANLIMKTELSVGDINFKPVTADFYSLKHLFLDELDSLSNQFSGHINPKSSLSKDIASHTTDITETTYLTGREGRKNEALKKIKFDILNI